MLASKDPGSSAVCKPCRAALARQPGCEILGGSADASGLIRHQTVNHSTFTTSGEYSITPWSCKCYDCNNNIDLQLGEHRCYADLDFVATCQKIKIHEAMNVGHLQSSAKGLSRKLDVTIQCDTFLAMFYHLPAATNEPFFPRKRPEAAAATFVCDSYFSEPLLAFNRCGC
jgi:hypothetical protein